MPRAGSVVRPKKDSDTTSPATSSAHVAKKEKEKRVKEKVQKAPRVKKVKEPRVPFEVPEDHILPTRGERLLPQLKWVLWTLIYGRLYRRFGKKWMLLKPTYADREAHLIGNIIDYAGFIKMVLVMLNEKGGAGKTPISAAVASVLAYITQRSTLLRDTNQATGNTAISVGVRRNETLSLLGCLSKFHLENGLKTADEAVLAYAQHALRWYGSLSVTRSADTAEREAFMQAHAELLTEEKIIEYFKVSADCFQFIVSDNGNSLYAEQCKAAVAVATAAFFCAVEENLNSIGDCKQTIEYYRIHNPELVKRRGIVCVAAHKGVYTLEEYAEMYGIPADRIFLIPKDPFYKRISKDKSEGVRLETFDFTKLSKSTRLQLLRLVEKVLELHDTVQYDPDNPQAGAASSDSGVSSESAIDLRDSTVESRELERV